MKEHVRRFIETKRDVSKKKRKKKKDGNENREKHKK